MHIATERLVLREFVIDDWPAVLAYQRDPRYLRFYPWANRTEAQVQDFVEMFVQQQSERPRRKFQFAITFPNDDTRAGEGGTATGKAVARE
jgi:[ribosomal protein S5]-alanine N-acetyltransferase